MANAYTGTGDVTALLPNYYQKSFLERLTTTGPILSEYCFKKPLPLHSGKVVYFPRMVNSSTQVSAYKLTEGTIISTEKIDEQQVSATIEQFGNAKAITDLTEMTAIDATTDETVKELADQAKNILDKRIRDEAYGTSSTPWGGGFSVAAADLADGAYTGVSAIGNYIGTSKSITTAMVRLWVKKLKARNVEPLDDGYFAFIGHSDTMVTLQADSTWQSAYQYTDPENMRRGVVGTYGGVKFQTDNNILVSAAGSSGANLYYSLLLGRGALGVTELNGGVKTYIKNPNDSTTSDPINQFSTFGWKANMVPKILNVSCGLICVTSDS